MSEQLRNEKEEKEEKDRGDSWDEKWRRDPVDAAAWALILIWAGLVLIAVNLNLSGIGWDAWPIIFIGAGVIVLLGVLIRLLVPAYRRPVTGNIIFGFILLALQRDFAIPCHSERPKGAKNLVLGRRFANVKRDSSSLRSSE